MEISKEEETIWVVYLDFSYHQPFGRYRILSFYSLFRKSSKINSFNSLITFLSKKSETSHNCRYFEALFYDTEKGGFVAFNSEPHALLFSRITFLPQILTKMSIFICFGLEIFSKFWIRKIVCFTTKPLNQ